MLDWKKRCWLWEYQLAAAALAAAAAAVSAAFFAAIFVAHLQVRRHRHVGHVRVVYSLLVVGIRGIRLQRDNRHGLRAVHCLLGAEHLHGIRLRRDH